MKQLAVVNFWVNPSLSWPSCSSGCWSSYESQRAFSSQTTNFLPKPSKVHTDKSNKHYFFYLHLPFISLLMPRPTLQSLKFYLFAHLKISNASDTFLLNFSLTAPNTYAFFIWIPVILNYLNHQFIDQINKSL